jgi:hypothetical protein
LAEKAHRPLEQKPVTHWSSLEQPEPTEPAEEPLALRQGPEAPPTKPDRQAPHVWAVEKQGWRLSEAQSEGEAREQLAWLSWLVRAPTTWAVAAASLSASVWLSSWRMAGELETRLETGRTTTAVWAEPWLPQTSVAVACSVTLKPNWDEPAPRTDDTWEMELPCLRRTEVEEMEEEEPVGNELSEKVKGRLLESAAHPKVEIRKLVLRASPWRGEAPTAPLLGGTFIVTDTWEKLCTAPLASLAVSRKT